MNFQVQTDSSLADLHLRSAYEYDLPEELIAQFPVADRVSSKLMILNPDGTVSHALFSDILEHIGPNDLLVRNVSRVIPARLIARKETGGKAEILLLNPRTETYDLDTASDWDALIKPARRLREGMKLNISDSLQVEILHKGEDGLAAVRLHWSGNLVKVLEEAGEAPLPPYIQQTLSKSDNHLYQTTYACTPGSVAAPTAGFHFTPQLDKMLRDRGADFAEVVLHVGLGTFRPVSADDVRDHKMHREYYEISPETAEKVNRAARVIAVGTTSVRVLETAARQAGNTAETNGDKGFEANESFRPCRVVSGSGWTDIFIRPPYDFGAVDAMITNFHLPGSTLIMLVSAFAGYSRVMAAYSEAVREKYRFYSFGDAMFIPGQSCSGAGKGE
ncbi:MAG: tRNA preQ1(34) S-adenosylmethionine ribosyltransferase-isomerase QueA [Candidatus Wallbacteria bacterium HGW-Wallbacteria-1]|jgi:S-adenosylmethionine:tRNA ribosyltransferase-isomerase|uniref:S-adenosylmethionine:tRNA ribosyltransferase-isomerase n=1 Tax=Candidatus Wallbacteria bacterium HGW-Wallbacteria-1 TaxID=2013854 RepID=A0A2N1PSK8_9BACT|nr:MAG: tRNA preQ1(34) S-adenosylmethionine ribosyltransferase-isomerase QueA [Candidatus Wallbacteria bacterium HGW-Wallbacteria-1]